MLEKYQQEQPIVYRIFKNILNQKKYSHAYLLETNGYDKGLEMVITFAKLLLCPKYQDGQVVCENCVQCQMIDDNNYTELKIVNPEGNWIRKEQLLDLQEEFKKKAIIGNKKIYILNQADRLNITSANSILKFLEEPQEGIIAILITDNRYQLLETIISRCQVISFNGQVDFQKQESTFFKIGQLLSNNLEEYTAFSEDEKNKEKIQALLKFVRYFEKNKQKILLYMNEYWFSAFQEKENTAVGMILLLYFYKDVLNYKVNYPIEIFNDYSSLIEEIANNNDIPTLTHKIDVINQCRLNLEYNANVHLTMDNLIIEMGGVLS